MYLYIQLVSLNLCMGIHEHADLMMCQIDYAYLKNCLKNHGVLYE